MAEFLFNFQLSDEEKELKESENMKENTVKLTTEYTPVLQSATEHQLDINKPLYQYIIHNHQKLNTRTIPKLHCNIQYIRLNDLETDHSITSIIGNDLCQLIEFTETENSDLVPGIYEGGLKVWECTFDLIEYFINTQVNFEGCRVLDLGCGVGLLGIYAVLNGAKEIHFQDYNREVVSCLTIPNVMLNILKRERSTPEHEVHVLSSDSFRQLRRCKFFSGDWSDFSTLLAEKHYKYDIILTSETIYCVDSQHKLLNVFQKCLKPQGDVFVAAKTHYFGVGGSISFFHDIVSKTALFDYKVAQEYSSNVPRQIIKLTLK